MSAFTQLKAADFTVRLVQPDNIGITPVEHLTDEQMQWVRHNRDSLLVELRGAADDGRRLNRWHGFIALAVSHGADPDAVQAMFNQQDIDDLLEEPEHKLPLHARTIANAIKSKNQQRNHF